MVNKGKIWRTNGLRRVFITLGLFVVLQLFFSAIDGTFLAPKLNRMGNFANELVETSFFKEWFIFYDNPIFNLVTLIAILHIIYISIMAVVVSKNTQKAN